METIFADFEQIIVPGMTHWQHPRFFAYFPANAAPVSVVAEYLVTRDGRAVHALADLAGGDRTRNRDDRLAAPGARPAGRVFGRHPGFGVVRDAGGRADHARAGARLAGQPRRACPGSRGCASTAPTRCTPRSTGRSGCRASARRTWCAFRPAGRWRAHGCRRRWRRRSRPTARRACCPAGIIACVGGTSVGGSDDVAAVCRRRRAGTGSICMSTPPGPARR